MSVTSLDHVNIRVPDLQGSLAFYRDLLGMAVVPPPGSTSITSGAWICDAAGRAIIHMGDAVLTAAAYGSPAEGSGSGQVHHFALECADYDAMRARLEAADFPFMANEVPQIGLRQIFVRDPNTIMVELNFRETPSA